MTQTRFLTTHVGSLPRPEALLNLVFAREGGEAVYEADFNAAVEAATVYVIKRQIEAGVAIVNDGEQSKALLRHLYQAPPVRLWRRGRAV